VLSEVLPTPRGPTKDTRAREPVLRHRIFQRARDVGLTDQIVKRLRPILSGEDLVFTSLSLEAFFKNVILSEAKLQRSGRSPRGQAFPSLIFPSRFPNEDNPRCLKAWPHASHFVAGASLNMTAPLRTNKRPSQFPGGALCQNCPNYRVIVMQQAPGQHPPPPQQPASLDEIVVALVSVSIACNQE